MNDRTSSFALNGNIGCRDIYAYKDINFGVGPYYCQYYDYPDTDNCYYVGDAWNETMSSFKIYPY